MYHDALEKLVIIWSLFNILTCTNKRNLLMHQNHLLERIWLLALPGLIRKEFAETKE